jgi:hypothetical protein
VRILDANLNRLREALRVIEEHVRFVEEAKDASLVFKELRHSLDEMEQIAGRAKLLRSRDTDADPLAAETQPQELRRSGVADVLTANFKRAQEAARVLEEYGKVGAFAGLSEKAKIIRFQLYNHEKTMVERLNNEQNKKK